ncbi:aldehyde dehydrogenase (NADP(+)) [Blastomonas fulva]|uniref:aldehyde dehydrogenase (NADP(+)) n=1 Tax=Blastomonas fulva TaxID=1550728 RepID=UPI003F71D496
MITGDLFIASQRVQRADPGFRAVAAATGSAIEPSFSIATKADVAAACLAANGAFPAYRALPRESRARFLEAIADQIEGLGDGLIDRAMEESGLPRARLTGERGRTAGQLRLFATELRLGDYLRVRIDHAQPDRTPPKPELRMKMVPLGPVAVFGASNFPLAFSVAGGDTASALAAGCPVVVKAHPAHPGTSELVASAILAAAADTGMPDGVFSMVNGADNAIGAALVGDARIRAVGFTGSRSGGLALMRLVQSRPVPIPIYAEMSSINPVFLLPAALEARAPQLAQGFVGSLSLGAGQFCTNPGLVIAMAGSALDRFLATAAEALEGLPAQVMLTPAICRAYADGVARWNSNPVLQVVGKGQAPDCATAGQAALFCVSGQDLLADPSLADEVFGAASLVVRCADLDEMAAVAQHLEGQLTATMHFDQDDIALARTLLPSLELLAGRILANGWPTGVEVTDAQVHGGPFPATSDGRSTSVGTMAIERFVRPVAYQDLPIELLPADIGDSDLTPRRVDGRPSM